MIFSKKTSSEARPPNVMHIRSNSWREERKKECDVLVFCHSHKHPLSTTGRDDIQRTNTVSFLQFSVCFCVHPPAKTTLVRVHTLRLYIRLAITSFEKVRFQQFQHFSVAINVLFHMVHLTQKCFSTQIWPFFALVPWINIHVLAYFE